jgi:HrpA-like RNA helicase
MVKALQVRAQLAKYCRRYGISTKPSPTTATVSAITKSIACGFFANAAVIQPDGSYRLIRGGTASMAIHPSSVLCDKPPEWLIFHELVLTSKPFMREVTALSNPALLQEVAPYFFQLKQPR